MFETFCIRLAAGLALATLLLPSKEVQPRFFRIQVLIVLGLIVAGTAAATNPPHMFWLGAGLAAGACLVGYGSWWLQGAPGGATALIGAAVSLTVALSAIHPGRPSGPGAPGWSVFVIADDLSAAAFLGLGLTAMLMGHWYLISPTMSIQPLLRLLKVFFVAVAFRLLVSLATIGLGEKAGLFDRLTILWLSLRWTSGFAGPAVLGWMAWQSAKIRSTQSATGILYVVVIFSFVGELTDQLLANHWRHLAIADS